MARELTARYNGTCLAGAECFTGGKVYAGQSIVWFEKGCVVHTGGCEDVFWGNQFAEREREQERHAFTIKMNRELQSTHWGSDPRAVMAP